MSRFQLDTWHDMLSEEAAPARVLIIRQIKLLDHLGHHAGALRDHAEIRDEKRVRVLLRDTWRPRDTWRLCA